MSVVNFSAAGSSPDIVVDVAGPQFGSVSIFIQAPGSGAWQEIYRADNAITTHHVVSLDAAALGVGAGVADWAGWAVGWVAIFIGFDPSQQQAYGAEVRIVQDGAELLAPPLGEHGTFTGPTKAVTDSVRIHVI